MYLTLDEAGRLAEHLLDLVAAGREHYRRAAASGRITVSAGDELDATH